MQIQSSYKQGVGGSNPSAPTPKKGHDSFRGPFFIVFFEKEKNNKRGGSRNPSGFESFCAHTQKGS
jgi:hypothetical protein